jgi:hypothetical protein
MHLPADVRADKIGALDGDAAGADVTDRWERALAATEAMAAGLGRLEPQLTELLAQAAVAPGWAAVSTEQVEAAVRIAWPGVIEQARRGRLDLGTEVIAVLNARLRAGAGLPDAVVFEDGRPPSTWSSLVDDILGGDGSPDLCDWDYAVMGQLAWGGHVPALTLSTAWLLISGLRLQAGKDAVAPRASLDDAFLAALDDTRPGLWDAEGMRALLGKAYP